MHMLGIERKRKYNATRNHVDESNLKKTKMELSKISRIQKRNKTPAIFGKFKVKLKVLCDVNTET